MRSIFAFCISLTLGFATTLLTGCSTRFTTAPSAPVQTAFGQIDGNIYGGRQPISNAHIYAYAAGTAGYGGASTSLLTSTGTSSFPTNVDADGNYYVTTNSAGTWSIAGSTTCTSGTQVYLYSIGGDAGSGENSAAGLMAVLGQCPSNGLLEDSIGHNTRVIINEAATVAAAFAVSGFATDPLHISSPAAGDSLAATGIANAFATAGNLYSLTYGNTGALATTPFGNGAVPQSKVNSLANVLAACVNTPGPGSPACSQLFANAMSAGATGNQASDTATAAIYIAHNPYSDNVATVFNLGGTAGTSPFQPQLQTAPTDFTLAITFTGGGIMATPGNDLVALALAIDAQGNVWHSNYTGNTVTELSPLGVPANDTGFTGDGLNGPRSIAIDMTGNVWVPNLNSNNFSILNSTGQAVTPLLQPTIQQPQSFAFDGEGHAWVGSSANNIYELSSTGEGMISLGGNQLVQPYILEVDPGPAGNVWAANFTGYYASAFTNSGAVLAGTPIQGLDEPNCVASNAIGDHWFADDANGATQITVSGSVVPHLVGQYLYGCSMDGASHFFVTDYYKQAVLELDTATGDNLSGTNGFTLVPSAIPDSVAVDGSGNIWVDTLTDNTIRELVGAATPVATPLAYGVTNNMLGQLP